MTIKKLKKNQDIQNILIVLASAVICAGLLAGFFLHYYGPTGRYLAGNTLLDPAVIDKINFQDKHPRTGQNVQFVFDHFAFSYFDAQQAQMQKKNVSLESYQQFYQTVGSERSLINFSKETSDLFQQSRPVLLTLTMRTEDGSDVLTTKIFQIIQFVPQDYFRVQLIEREQEVGGWAYFYKPGIYRDVLHLFSPPS